MSKFMHNLRVSPWALFVIVGLVLALLPIWPNAVTGKHGPMTGYVMSWLGSTFQAVSGAIIGWLFTRHVMRINLSQIADEQARALAGLGVCIFSAVIAVAVCVAV